MIPLQPLWSPTAKFDRDKWHTVGKIIEFPFRCYAVIFYRIGLGWVIALKSSKFSYSLFHYQHFKRNWNKIGWKIKFLLRILRNENIFIFIAYIYIRRPSILTYFEKPNNGKGIQLPFQRYTIYLNRTFGLGSTRVWVGSYTEKHKSTVN